MLDITLNADTFENMQAAYIAAANQMLPEREVRDGDAIGHFRFEHVRAVVSGRIEEPAPTDADPSSIVLADDAWVVRRRVDDRVRMTITNNPPTNPAYAAEVFRVAANVTPGELSCGQARLVWLGGEQVCVMNIDAYRHGLRVNKRTAASDAATPATHKHVITEVREAAARDGRELAKFMGGRALTGTAKQKTWGEQIRAEKLVNMTESQVRIACDPKGLAKTAKFWIENRALDARDIGSLLERQKELLAQATELREQGKAEEYAAVAEKYNSVTAALGIGDPVEISKARLALGLRRR